MYNAAHWTLIWRRSGLIRNAALFPAGAGSLPRVLLRLGGLACVLALCVSPASAETRYKVGNSEIRAVHLREGPSNRSAIIGYIAGDSVVAAAGKCQKLWCEVAFKGREGWVYRPYLKETDDPLDDAGEVGEAAAAPDGTEDAAKPKEPGVFHAIANPPATTVNLQQSPGPGMPLVGLIPSRAKNIADLGECSQGWCKVRYQGIEGWAPASGLRREDGTVPSDMRAAALAGRAKPPNKAAARDAEETGTLPPEADDPPPPPDVVTKYALAGLPAGGTLPLRRSASPAAAIVASLPENAEVEGQGQCVREWCKVRYKGASGFVEGRFLANPGPPSPSRFRVTDVDLTAELGLYDRPGEDGKIVGQIPSYATGIVPIGECGRDWCHILYRSQAGWVNSRFLAREGPGARAAN
jgi:SH3-like domain-containing protein